MENRKNQDMVPGTGEDILQDPVKNCGPQQGPFIQPEGLPKQPEGINHSEGLSQPDNVSQKSLLESNILVPVVAGVVVGGTALMAVPPLLTAAGFGTGGITAGSLAASMMSSAATSGFGMGVVSALQSAGAAGLALSTKGLIVVGASAGAHIANHASRTREEQDNPDNSGPGNNSPKMSEPRGNVSQLGLFNNIGISAESLAKLASFMTRGGIGQERNKVEGNSQGGTELREKGSTLGLFSNIGALAESLSKLAYFMRERNQEGNESGGNSQGVGEVGGNSQGVGEVGGNSQGGTELREKGSTLVLFSNIGALAESLSKLAYFMRGRNQEGNESGGNSQGVGEVGGNSQGVGEVGGNSQGGTELREKGSTLVLFSNIGALAESLSKLAYFMRGRNQEGNESGGNSQGVGEVGGNSQGVGEVGGNSQGVGEVGGNSQGESEVGSNNQEQKETKYGVSPQGKNRPMSGL